MSRVGLFPGQWYTLHARSHCEQLVFDQLSAKGYHLFLPKVEMWSYRFGKRQLILTPMFPGYLFRRHLMDKASYIDVRKARELARILGEHWKCLSVIPDEEIDAIRRILHVRLPMMPHPFLREGQQVCIMRGPLTGVEGILIQYKPTRGLLVLSVDLLQRSVAIEVDCSLVAAA